MEQSVHRPLSQSGLPIVRRVNSAFRERGLKPPWSLNAALTQLLRRLPRIKRGRLAVLLHDVCAVAAKAAEPLGAVRARKAQQVRIRVLALLVHEVHHLADTMRAYRGIEPTRGYSDPQKGYSEPEGR